MEWPHLAHDLVSELARGGFTLLGAAGLKEEGAAAPKVPLRGGTNELPGVVDLASTDLKAEGEGAEPKVPLRGCTPVLAAEDGAT